MKIIEEPPLAGDVERKLPWVIDIFLYPLSVSGLIHIVIFLVIPFVISLIHRFILGWIWPVGELIFVLLYLLYVGYVFFYLGYCIFDSSKGGLRAPEVLAQHTPDKGDCISQMGLLLGCIAVCFWPVGVYYIFTQQKDWIFCLLSVCGIFFFPMALLAVVLFDALNALSPILIINSIIRTFLPYCGMILSFCVLGGLATGTAFLLLRLSVPRLLYKGISLYLLFIAAHLLGRFYWWHKDKLDWSL